MEFTSWDISKIPRTENYEADRLSKYTSIAIPSPKELKERIFVECLPERTTSAAYLEVLDLYEEASRLSWMDLILNYLRDGSLPSDRKEAKSIIYKASNYTIINGVLYKWGFSFPLLRCLHLEEGLKVLEDLYVGECSNHIKAQSLYIQVTRAGYFWLTMRADAKNFVQSCK